MRTPECFAPGCYRVEPGGRFLWIAANELPLLDELVPFLMARSGQALDDFGRWIAPPRRPLEWLLTMLEYLPMSMPAREELLWRFGKAEDPEVEARRQHILKVLLEASPETQQQLIDKGRSEGRLEGQLEGRLAEARAALRRVLVQRQLTPSKDEDARIEACTELTTLERWHERAVTAAGVSDALQ